MLEQKQETNLNSIIGIFLIFLILIIYSVLNQPSQEEIDAAQSRRDSIANIENEIRQQIKDEKDIKTIDRVLSSEESAKRLSEDVLLAEQVKKKFGPFSNAVNNPNKFITIENELVKITLSTKGGRVFSVQLKNFQTYDSLPLILFHGDSSTLDLSFFIQNKIIFTKDLYFKPDGDSFTVRNDDKKSISMRVYLDRSTYQEEDYSENESYSRNKYIEFLYTLKGNSYMLDFDINIVGLEDVIATNTNYLNMDWKVYITRQEKSVENERMNTTIYYKYLKDEVDYISETSDEKETLTTKIKWLGFKQQFFTSAIIAKNSFDKPTYIESNTPDEDNEEYVKYLTASLTIPYSHGRSETFPMTFYFGPNNYQILKDLELELENIIPLGWGIFGYVNKVIVIPMFHFLEKYIDNYGIIILILTLVIKIFLFPLMYKSYMSTAKMRVLKPEVDEINAKFPKKEDAMKKQQAVMSLYKKTGVNPLGGCLPMVVQMPILYAMFRFFPSSIELRQQGFLWAHDLSTYDSIYDFPGGFEIPFYGDHVSLFTLLMTAATLLSVKMNSEMSGSAQMQMPQMKVMMYMMPIMFLGFFNSFASGLSYYYFIATMITFGQQYAMRRFVNEDEILRKIQEFKKKPAPKKSNFQKKLEKMAKKKGKL